ncbi:hypothetical protein LTR36_005485 [Oleoguttula mirabilis]|uniref:Rho-GAP domain-containing protein n=1 Tax=Oleoguttula mirabilis TaxID=1507867 RepID=A0AAV9JE72_9PEZI|nr:hypothetical protein LTR36_005485 [Oleoguttula mirabilis]
MSRQKSNQTRPTKSNRIVWTVEWITGAGDHMLRHDCAESDAVASMYETHLLEKYSNMRKPKGSKRKRNEADPSEQIHALGESELVIAHTTAVMPEHSASDALADATGTDPSAQSDIERVTTLTGAMLETKVQTALKDEKRIANLDATQLLALDEHESVVPQTAARESPTVLAQDEEQQADASASETVRVGRELHFYLLKPATSSASKVVVPLRSEATLTECLRDQVVQEYPSIVVLDAPKDALPEGFVLHQDYVRSRRGEDAEQQELFRASGSTRLVSATSSAQPPTETEELDAQSILDMLKRDVRT